MGASQSIKRKITRLRAGNSPRFMDLFAGCGGITLGFATAGYDLVASVESDAWAADSHGANFAAITYGKHHDAHFKARDITAETPASIFCDLGISGPVDEQVDVLVGGPPCQAFARVGRAKLRYEAHRREEDDADIAFLVDGRVNLWKAYLKYVRETKPVALLMENVPDILNHGGKNVAEIVSEHLREEGYLVRYTLLNASWFGVPQTRERMFLIGVHEDLDTDVKFPSPTHHFILPSGYEGTRATARKLISDFDLEFGGREQSHCWISDPSPDGLPPTTTAREAFADLPPIYALDLLKRGKLVRGRKNPAEPVMYTPNSPQPRGLGLCASGHNSAPTDHTTGHVIRYLPRDYKIFRLMEEGWQYPEVWSFVEAKREQLMNRRWKTARMPIRISIKAVDVAIRPHEVPEQVVEALQEQTGPDPYGTLGQGFLQPHSLRKSTGKDDFRSGGRAAAIVSRRFRSPREYESRIQANRQRRTAACRVRRRHGNAINDRLPFDTRHPVRVARPGQAVGDGCCRKE